MFNKNLSVHKVGNGKPPPPDETAPKKAPTEKAKKK